ncbi:MAG: response regulator transcription factor [Candidatus Pacebacteria bacterium]|nr:response regulator transcription factor [Candidatus Paceibacterota bacterium]
MRALIIDDEDGVRDTLSRHLRAECFAVDTARDGAEGSYLARTNEYDIVILDNMMPRKSGVEVCEEIRSTGRSMPILVLSVLGETRQKVHLINAGADDYMIKPFSFDELMARVRALMRRPKKLESDILVLDDIALDIKQQRVRRAGKIVYLTRKEFMLLEYLMRNPGVVLSRGMIMEHVWDMTSDPFSNTIESHILSLRKKIGDTGKERMIQTVPGRGYKIEALYS